ncbi:MAG: aspartate-semialdehyde dehydrogenase [Bacteroidales bacterium]|nr:aspartate-semialdehyde dehydrogenase [Bacteroidales bacterium]
MKIAIVGATGLVGSKMISVLDERNFPVSELLAVASEKSVGKEVLFRGKPVKVISLEQAVQEKPDIALFSAGGSTSLQWAPKFAAAGTTVIDNSSAWRMDKNIPLVVPEINGDVLKSTDKIIANPNCSTIQMVLVLAPLHKAFDINRIIVSTYQSVSGSGIKGIQQLTNEQEGNAGTKAYPHPIHRNVLPHGGDFDSSGYTTEELKLVNETRKILNDYSLNISATVVRVPVTGGHSESVNVEFKKPFTLKAAREQMAAMPGVVIQDDPERFLYPMPIYAEGKDEVFVGRIRRDDTIENGLNLWVVSDNLRKGAATNAVQIAEYLLQHDLIH